jgi:hypothetical protein
MKLPALVVNLVVHLVILAALQLAAAGAARAATAEERLAQNYLEATIRGGPEAALDFYHPDEVTALRLRVLEVLEKEAAAGGDAIRGRAFGMVTSLEDVRRLIPSSLFTRVAAATGWPSGQVEKVEALGTVAGKEQQYVLLRVTPPAQAGRRAHLQVVTLLRHGRNWRVALPVRFQEQVDALLSPPDAPQAQPPAEEPAAPNTLGIESLLATAVELLAAGRCAEYFKELMSPNFRASTSPQALQRLIAQCERSVDTRETYIAALRVAQGATPKYENGGVRAVYDMRGKGLPFERFVLERVDLRWYIAE